MSDNIVYVSQPELTLFKDTLFECEVIRPEKFNRSKLRVKSVLMSNGKMLPDLTARNENSIIIVSNRKLYSTIEELKRASISQSYCAYNGELSGIATNHESSRW